MSEHRLDEVLIERPRGGMRMSSRRLPGMRKHMTQLTREAEEDGLLSPYRIKVRDKTKYLSDHLGPMRRLLRSQLGKPWDQIYSKIRREVKGNTMAGQHVLEHLSGYVCSSAEMVNGQPYAKGGTGYYWNRRPLGLRRNEFYVHPETGLLCLADTRKQNPRTQQPQKLIRVNQTFEYRLVQGIWYGIEFEAISQRRTVYDQLLRREISGHEAIQTYGRCMAATQKRQCNKKKLRWIRTQLRVHALTVGDSKTKKRRSDCSSFFFMEMLLLAHKITESIYINAFWILALCLGLLLTWLNRPYCCAAAKGMDFTLRREVTAP